MKQWMKKLLKWGLVIFSVILLIITGLVIWQWDTIAIMTGNADVHEETAAVPEPVVRKEIPPVKEGEADWPCWRGPDHDGRSRVTGIIKEWGAGLEKKWEVDFLCSGKASAVWSSPVVKGSRLVVMGRHDRDDTVYCLNTENGELIWKTSYEAAAQASYGKGSRATPCIEDARVYTFGRSGDLVCWNLENGEKIWHENVSTEGGSEPTWGHSTSPLIYGDSVIVNGGGSARTIAYNKMTGTVKWKSGSGHPGYAALVMMNIEEKPVLITFHGKGLAALSPDDGTELWNTEWKTPYDVHATTPVFFEDRIFITSGYGTGGELLKVTFSSAEPLWRNKEISSHHSDPYIISGCIYGYSGDSMQNKGRFKCVDLETGLEKWSTNEMGWGTCTWADGHLICLDIKGNLFLMKPDPEKFRLITSIPGLLGKVKGAAWTVPVAANGNLYIRHKQKLICFRLTM